MDRLLTIQRNKRGACSFFYALKGDKSHDKKTKEDSPFQLEKAIPEGAGLPVSDLCS